MTKLQAQVNALMAAGCSTANGMGPAWQARRLGVHVSTIYKVRKELQMIREAQANKEATCVNPTP